MWYNLNLQAVTKATKMSADFTTTINVLDRRVCLGVSLLSLPCYVHGSHTQQSITLHYLLNLALYNHNNISNQSGMLKSIALSPNQTSKCPPLVLILN
jgi:hypothetical protein